MDEEKKIRSMEDSSFQILRARVERWIRLQQFLHELDSDYSYAMRFFERDQRWDSCTLISSGGLTWFGRARAKDRQKGLASALMEAGEALSSNCLNVFFFKLKNRLLRLRR